MALAVLLPLVGDVLTMPLAIATLAWHGELRGVAVPWLTGPTGSGGGVLAEASMPCGEVLTIPEGPFRALQGVAGELLIHAAPGSLTGTAKKGWRHAVGD